MTQSVRSHTGPTALIKLAQDVLNTEIAGSPPCGTGSTPGRRKKPPSSLRWGFWRRAPGVWS